MVPHVPPISWNMTLYIALSCYHNPGYIHDFIMTLASDVNTNEVHLRRINRLYHYIQKDFRQTSLCPVIRALLWLTVQWGPRVYGRSDVSCFDYYIIDNITIKKDCLFMDGWFYWYAMTGIWVEVISISIFITYLWHILEISLY